MKKIVCAILVLVMLLGLIPAIAFAAEAQVLESCKLEKFDKNTKADGETQTVGSYTIYWSAKSKVDGSNKKWSDGYEPATEGEEKTLRINFGGKTQFKEDGSILNAIKFTVTEASTVKVWWVQAGNKDGDPARQVAVYSEAGEVLSKTEDASAQNDPVLSTLEVSAAGTYFLGNPDGSNYIFKVEVAPKAAAAPETPAATTYTKVTEGTLTTGKYVLVANNGKALDALDGKWALSADPTMDGDKMTAGPVVTLTVEGTTVTITDANGKNIAPVAKKNELGDTGSWNWKFADGTFTFDDGNTEVNADGVSQTRYLSSVGKDATNRFRAYRNPSAEPDSYGNTYFHLFTLYKVEGDTSTPPAENPPAENPPAENPPAETPKLETPADILNAAYALEKGGKLEGEFELTGVVTEITTIYSEQYKNITVTIAVKGLEDKPISCYRLSGEGAEAIVVGDTLTVKGEIQNYNGSVQFSKPALIKREATGVVDTFDPTTMTPAELVDAAYALEEGKSLSKEFALTGKVTEVGTAYSEQYKNVTFTIVIEGKEDKPIVCFRAKGDEAANVAVGDTVTVNGQMTNYKGTIEFNSGCQITARVAAPVENPPVDNPNPPTGDLISIFAMTAAVSAAAMVLLKKKEN